MTNYPKVCVPRLFKGVRRESATQAAIRENPLNRAFGAAPFHPKRLSVEVGRRWANGRVLHVRFLNGDSLQREKTEREARSWENYANIKFVFDDSPDAEIRVAFNNGVKPFDDPGSWATLGTDALIVPKAEQNVNFGWLDKDTPDVEWRRVVIHEFGHVLGCDHEDQQPAANINWNKDAVYAYFQGPPNNWLKEDVDFNVLDRTPEQNVIHTPFDPVSIMAYFIPPQFTTDGQGVPGGDDLSVLDKQLIGQMYPLGIIIDPVNPVVPNLIPGTPAMNSVIDVAHPVNNFSLHAIITGQYRIWTSFLNGTVKVFRASDLSRPVASGLQQVTFKAVPGRYLVTVAPSVPGIQTTYRIVSRRIR